MEKTHRARMWRQTKLLWSRNIVSLMLAFGLSGTIAVAANDVACAHASLGTFGHILPWLFRQGAITSIVVLGNFYLLAGFAFYFTSQKLRFREIQRRFFQPFFAPTMFVVAGYLLGLPAAHMDEWRYAISLISALLVLFMSTIVNSMYEILEAGHGGHSPKE